ncbi:hypothetical protein D7U98_02445 [Stenotrophomonas maltophilia]|uniref:Uncharacterized protein n=2 Tax=Stenotrophomonas maltophilia TaxID=40324 RepID=B4SPR3_STRM5|nr:hypothetical protein [Stenotrophomonas maltophilia]ACF52333.1 hypothetical protein Smal_2633 [Stenotrophomonas maltophilia R551-3]MBA0394268.1 hypothetical protein [Stenotrophomonas maltophilia]PJL02679.1 hypothetical protein B9Y63_12140 [Stenotrophomonas maltophilia]PJL41975.1 hypothetical protein B9Y56_14470 [Stenotrophomonas maltophilia]QGL76899.1 hypothetical protein FEO95_15245 [Stenotrophomonas maltophilia]
MRAVLLAALALLAGPALASPPAPPSVWLERQQTAAADEADAAAANAVKPKEHCRVVKEWKAGETVVQHRICDDPPKKPAEKV